MKAKPIAMKCNQEQFDRIKPKLDKATVNTVSSFEEYPYLVNFDAPEGICLSNIDKELFSHLWCQNPEIHETWNELIFLEACGIEVKETYKITKDQIIILNTDGNKDVRRCVQEWYPSVFKEDKKESVLPVDFTGWVRDRKHEKFLVYSDKGFLIYGFDIYGKWIGKDGHIVKIGIDEYEAYNQEIQQALENEARKRYKKDDCIIGLYNKKRCKLSFENMVRGTSVIYVDEYYSVWMNIGNGRNEKVFDNGIWTEIIQLKPMTKQQIEKELGYEIKIVQL